EAGEETAEGAEDVPVRGGDTDSELSRAARPHRGSTFLTAELGTPALAAIMGALFAVERRVTIRLAEAGAAAIGEETARLCRALRRSTGRGAFTPPSQVAGRAAPAVYEAFVRAYDWEDPSDPQ